MTGIFISYRRSDSAPYAGRIYDHLCSTFGQHNIFMDIDTIRPGADFVAALQQAVASCNAFVAVIGSDWLTAADGDGKRRLEDPKDFVRLEIAEALARNILVIPVLVGGAVMPNPDALPQDLAEFARRNALTLTNERFRYDVSKLIGALQIVIPEQRTVETVAETTAPQSASMRQQALTPVTPPPALPSLTVERMWGAVIWLATGFTVPLMLLALLDIGFQTERGQLLVALPPLALIAGFLLGLALKTAEPNITWRQVSRYACVICIVLSIAAGVASLLGGEALFWRFFSVFVIVVGIACLRWGQRMIVTGIAWSQTLLTCIVWVMTLSGVLFTLLILSRTFQISDQLLLYSLMGLLVGIVGGLFTFWQLRRIQLTAPLTKSVKAESTPPA